MKKKQYKSVTESYYIIRSAEFIAPSACMQLWDLTLYDTVTDKEEKIRISIAPHLVHNITCEPYKSGLFFIRYMTTSVQLFDGSLFTSHRILRMEFSNL